MGIPASYKTAKWRGTLPADLSGNVGISFEMEDGAVMRVRLGAGCIRHLRETLDSTWPGAEQQEGSLLKNPMTYAELPFQHRLLQANGALIELAEQAPLEIRHALQQAASLVDAAVRGKAS